MLFFIFHTASLLILRTFSLSFRIQSEWVHTAHHTKLTYTMKRSNSSFIFFFNIRNVVELHFVFISMIYGWNTRRARVAYKF